MKQLLSFTLLAVSCLIVMEMNAKTIPVLGTQYVGPSQFPAASQTSSTTPATAPVSTSNTQNTFGEEIERALQHLHL